MTIALAETLKLVAKRAPAGEKQRGPSDYQEQWPIAGERYSKIAERLQHASEYPDHISRLRQPANDATAGDPGTTDLGVLSHLSGGAG